MSALVLNLEPLFEPFESERRADVSWNATNGVVTLSGEVLSLDLSEG